MAVTGWSPRVDTEHMATETVAAVYGTPAGQSRIQRLGSGMLPSPQLVVVDPPLDAALASADPPRPLQVALAALRSDGTLFVELRDVARVLESVALGGAPLWGLELSEPARAPAIFWPGKPISHQPVPQLDAKQLAALLHGARPKQPGRPPNPHPHGFPIPVGLWCVLFPHASYCR